MKWLARLFGFDKKPHCCFPHYKEAGFTFPENMKKVFAFINPTSKASILPDCCYIFECSGCGKRAYMHGGPILPQTVIDAVDLFIDHEIDVDSLTDAINFYGYSTSPQITNPRGRREMVEQAPVCFIKHREEVK